jgi:hypothetical protein
MDAIMPFALKGFLLSGMLTGYYCIALRNKPLHYFNRFFLLVTIVLSLTLPLLHFNWAATPLARTPALGDWLNDQSAGNLPEQNFGWGVERWVMAWAVISFFLFGVLLVKMGKILTLKRKYSTIKKDGYYYIETELPEAPFSFFNYLFWKKAISPESEYGKKIIQHELTHIRQGHSYDKLFSQTVTCLFWMNPFFWIIQNELNMIHEFIADEKSIEDRDTESFAQMLLLSVTKGSYLQPGHSFFQSPVKRRILLLEATRPVNYSQVRKWMVLPLCFFGISLVSFQGVSRRQGIRMDNFIQIFSQNEALTDTAGDSARQKPQEWTAAKVHQLVVQIVRNPPDVIFYVNGVVTPRENIKKLDPEKIATMNIFKGKDAISRHGEKARNGVIEFTIP